MVRLLRAARGVSHVAIVVQPFDCRRDPFGLSLFARPAVAQGAPRQIRADAVGIGVGPFVAFERTQHPLMRRQDESKLRIPVVVERCVFNDTFLPGACARTRVLIPRAHYSKEEGSKVLSSTPCPLTTRNVGTEEQSASADQNNLAGPASAAGAAVQADRSKCLASFRTSFVKPLRSTKPETQTVLSKSARVGCTGDQG